MLFANRYKAGELLAKELASYKGNNVIVVAIPRGGVPVGYKVAEKLRSPLSVLGIKKIGSPWDKEFAIGAIAEEGTLFLDKETIQQQHIRLSSIRDVIKDEKEYLQKKIAFYRKRISFPQIKNKHVILVDDGLATGISAKAAILALSKQHPKSILFTAPVCSAQAKENVFTIVTNIVCIYDPVEFE